jgi:hypothetical protein
MASPTECAFIRLEDRLGAVMCKDLYGLVLKCHEIPPGAHEAFHSKDIDLVPMAACSAEACRFHSPRGLLLPQVGAVLTEIDPGPWTCAYDGLWTISMFGGQILCYYDGTTKKAFQLNSYDAFCLKLYMQRMATHFPRVPTQYC